MKQRITLIVDRKEMRSITFHSRSGAISHGAGVTVESVEDISDPIIDTYIVKIDRSIPPHCIGCIKEALEASPHIGDDIISVEKVIND